MHLHLRTVLGGLNASAASRVTTQGSGTHSVGNLESIQEGSTTDSQSDTFSTFGNEMDHDANASDLGDRKASTWSKGKMRDNPFDDPIEEMDFNVMLIFQYENFFGAEIYKDPLCRYAFKTADNRTPFNQFPMVNYQGDLYMGKDGSRYQVTKYPQQVDACGVLQAGPMSFEVPNPEATTSGLNKIGTSTNPTGLGLDHKSPLDKLFADFHFDEGDESFKWKLIRNINVTKVFQDNVVQEVFRDSSDVYYETTRLPHLQFLVQHTVTLEQLGLETRVRDEHKNHFRTLEWNKVRDLTWKGKPLFSYEPPASTARPGHVAYSTETKAPKPKPSFSEWTTARGPLPFWSMPPAHEREDRIDPGLERLGGSRHPMEAVRFIPPQEDMEKGRPHRRHDDDHRKVRPSALQKLVKKYDGSGDPYDHVAAYRQVVHAEHVRDTRTQIEDFDQP